MVTLTVSQPEENIQTLAPKVKHTIVCRTEVDGGGGGRRGGRM